MGGFGAALWGGGGPAGLVSVTGNSLIYGALRLLGVLRPGQIPSPDAANDGLAWLNELFDSWATERLMVKLTLRTGIVMDGSASYTVLPHRIERAGYVHAGETSEGPVEVYGIERWQRSHRNPTVGAPVAIYPEYTVPESTVTPWPQPADGDLYIYQWAPLDAFGDLTTSYALPAGYALALRFCLAAQIAPAFAIVAKISKPQLASIEAKAAEYKGRIKSLNSASRPMVVDNPVPRSGQFDILTGEPW